MVSPERERMTVPASWNHHAERLAEIVRALQSQLTGVFNWCLAGARRGRLLTHPVLTVVDALTHTLQRKVLAVPALSGWR